jgi:hypothetical protein
MAGDQNLTLSSSFARSSTQNLIVALSVGAIAPIGASGPAGRGMGKPASGQASCRAARHLGGTGRPASARHHARPCASDGLDRATAASLCGAYIWWDEDASMAAARPPTPGALAVRFWGRPSLREPHHPGPATIAVTEGAVEIGDMCKETGLRPWEGDFDSGERRHSGYLGNIPIRG